MGLTNKNKKSKINLQKYSRKILKGGENYFGDYTENCVISPFKKGWNVLKTGFNQLNDLTKKTNEKIESELKTLNTKLSSIPNLNKSEILPVRQQIKKTLKTIDRSDREINDLEVKTKDKLKSEIRTSPGEIITMRDLRTNSKGGKKRRLIKSKKKKRRNF